MRWSTAVPSWNRYVTQTVDCTLVVPPIHVRGGFGATLFGFMSLSIDAGIFVCVSNAGGYGIYHVVWVEAVGSSTHLLTNDSVLVAVKVSLSRLLCRRVVYDAREGFCSNTF